MSQDLLDFFEKEKLSPPASAEPSIPVVERGRSASAVDHKAKVLKKMLLAYLDSLVEYLSFTEREMLKSVASSQESATVYAKKILSISKKFGSVKHLAFSQKRPVSGSGTI